ncbi:aminotransferase class I/II-fold pyridoxal phosphate-dependent enzyme [Heyndrickxia sp. NPDC080065]|uniref:aminotransferase class I/II-fold pyridoxal phosphate-dependent enzyme n=1 Tax=Heyndrickxia sp. NPDC080065 TaxID=3390568 RepID=UPI003CFD4BA1
MNQNRLPLYESLVNFFNKQPISFHVPGHKNGFLFQKATTDILEFMKYDVTELTGLDDLHSPSGPILEAQQLLTNYYGTRKSYFLVNGSTVGNLIMVLSAFKEGDCVLVQRNCHKSILNALMLANVNPIFLTPAIDEQVLVPGCIDSTGIKEAYIQYPDAKGCILTYPSYYGMTADLREIINIVHQHNGIVLVDEAHGPHFRLGSPFPMSAIDLGADMIVQSAHKMLPAMTMGSYLHINSDVISLDKVEYYYSALQSSSPSYPIMASLDFARYFISTFSHEDMNYTIKQRNQFIDDLSRLEGIKVVESIYGQDPLKVLVRYEGYSGFEFQQLLEDEGVYTEMADPYQVVMILPLLKKEMVYFYREAIDRIKQALRKNKPHQKQIKRVFIETENNISCLMMSYDEMKDKPFEWVSFDNAINRVAAKMIIPYPPGIPIILPGEMITNKKIKLIKGLMRVQAKFQDESMRIMKEEIAVFKE